VKSELHSGSGNEARSEIEHFTKGRSDVGSVKGLLEAVKLLENSDRHYQKIVFMTSVLRKNIKHSPTEPCREILYPASTKINFWPILLCLCPIFGLFETGLHACQYFSICL
jgi:hypothetical protein